MSEEDHLKNNPSYLETFEVHLFDAKDDSEVVPGSTEYIVASFEEDKFSSMLIHLKQSWNAEVDSMCELKFPKEMLLKKDLKCGDRIQVHCFPKE